MMLKICYFVSVLILSACGSSPTTPAEPVATVEVTSNSDSTRTVARKVNGLLEGRTVVYRPTGAIADIFYFRHDSAEGIQRRFYPNGRLMSWQQTHQGRPHGKSYDFLANGALAHIEHFNRGQRTGTNLWFYDHPRNQLRVVVELLSVGGKEWQNGYAEYDTLGRLVARKGFLRVRAERDTIALGDSLALHLRVLYPQYTLVAAVTGDFDSQFRLHEPTSLRRRMGRNHVLAIRVPAMRRGNQVARGYVADFQDSTQNTPHRQPGSGQRLYFAYPYFVR